MISSREKKSSCANRRSGSWLLVTRRRRRTARCGRIAGVIVAAAFGLRQTAEKFFPWHLPISSYKGYNVHCTLWGVAKW
jgi:hypothetical protein